tara:strand:- start:102980 stop:104047 length:1068 start_codon:yes stop_codon:yes gene_type:complete
MSRTLEAIATSDWHFMGLAKHFPNHVERTIYELDKIYQYAVANGIPYVLVPGDISDTPHMPYEVYIALVLFLKKYDGLVETHYIPGNHDFSDVKKTSMDLLSVLQQNQFFESFHLHMGHTEIELEDVPINFLPYPWNEAPASDIPHLNFSHISYNGAIGDNGRKIRVKDEFIQNPGDFNISGHIHQYQYMESKRALYCGNPFQKNFGEKLPKGFVHFKAKLKDERIAFKHKFVDNKPDFRLINMNIESREDFARLSDSDSIRYKLWLAAGVEIPKDLRLRFPNITGGIFDLDSKVRAQDREEVKTLIQDPSANQVDLMYGLKDYMKGAGFKKRDYQEARSLVKQAANELGLDLVE